VWHVQFFEGTDKTLQQIGNYNAPEQGCNYTPQGQQNGKKQNYQQREYDGFFFGEIAIIKAMEYFDHA
jgi:hypothetical protein